MKKAEEYLGKVNTFTLKEKLYKIGKQMQIDAYNEALEDAVKNVKTKEDANSWSGQVWDDGPLDIIVDKDSILKLKK